MATVIWEHGNPRCRVGVDNWRRRVRVAVVRQPDLVGTGGGRRPRTNHELLRSWCGAHRSATVASYADS